MAVDNVIDGIIEPIKKGFNFLLDVFWKIISYPFILWNKLPEWVHTGVLISLVILGFIILIYVYYTRKDVYKVDA